MYSRILVPVDGSVHSNLALHEATKLGRALHASIRLLHILDTASLLTAETTGASYSTLFDTVCRDAEQLLMNAAVAVKDGNVVVDTVLIQVPHFPIGDHIVRQARDYQAELIVCGTHGRRGIRRLFMGSDAGYIVRHAAVPVLLVRTPDPASEPPPAPAATVT